MGNKTRTQLRKKVAECESALVMLGQVRRIAERYKDKRYDAVVAIRKICDLVLPAPPKEDSE